MANRGFTPRGHISPKGTTSPLGNNFTPGGQISPLGDKFLPWGTNFSPGGQISPLGDNFTPREQISPLGDNFTPKEQISPLGDNFAPGGSKFAPWGQSSPLEVKVHPSGLKLTPRGQSSPLGVKVRPWGLKLTPRGEIKNRPLVSGYWVHAASVRISEFSTSVNNFIFNYNLTFWLVWPYILNLWYVPPLHIGTICLLWHTYLVGTYIRNNEWFLPNVLWRKSDRMFLKRAQPPKGILL
jgi:hypothetical protein